MDKIQYVKISTEIGLVRITRSNGKIVTLRLPKHPSFKKGKYKYKDILKLPPGYNLGTPFQNLIWRYIKKIPYGRTITYKKIADDLSLGHAYRAVGQACKNNPIPIIIPCHRIVTSNGKIGGYSRGLKWKRFLINLEKGRI